MVQNDFPTGWNEEKVYNVIAYYENQTEDEAVAEDESAFTDENEAVMTVPHKLVPIVEKLIAGFSESKTARAIVQSGRLELLENVQLPEGAKVLVTFLSEDDAAFWLGVSQSAFDAIWNNEEDDVYAELLKA